MHARGIGGFQRYFTKQFLNEFQPRLYNLLFHVNYATDAKLNQDVLVIQYANVGEYTCGDWRAFCGPSYNQ